MKKIKILRIIARLNIGGPAIHTVILTEGLRNPDFESILACGKPEKDEGDMSYYALRKGVKPVFIPELRREINLSDDITALIKIYKIIKASAPDILHTHTAKAGALGRLAAVLYNCPRFFRKRVILIHTFHGHIFDGYFSKARTRLFIFIERLLALFTDKIITVSSSVRDELIGLRISRKDKIEVIPLGLELERFLRIPVNDRAPVNIGIIGRLVPIKNHLLFLNAAARIISGNPDTPLRFKVIGDGELRGPLERHAQNTGIGRYVDFLGWQEDLPGLYSGLDMVALASINEGTPVSLIEAMASARIVVATDVGGVRDLMGRDTGKGIKDAPGVRVMERGIIAPSGDADSFAAALMFIARDDSLRSDIEEAARGFVKESFAKERLISDIKNLYTRLLSSHKKL